MVPDRSSTLWCLMQTRDERRRAQRGFDLTRISVWLCLFSQCFSCGEGTHTVFVKTSNCCSKIFFFFFLKLLFDTDHPLGSLRNPCPMLNVTPFWQCSLTVRTSTGIRYALWAFEWRDVFFFSSSNSSLWRMVLRQRMAAGTIEKAYSAETLKPHNTNLPH